MIASFFILHIWYKYNTEADISIARDATNSNHRADVSVVSGGPREAG
jgi:hypothetical protein